MRVVYFTDDRDEKIALLCFSRISTDESRGSGNYASDEAKEIARLKRELRDAQDALEVLKKAINILGK